jgi:hypothetical protein
MSFTISASLANVVAKEFRALQPDPSSTIWSRLEPLPTSDDIAQSLQARIADPLWMLARQWQFNEWQGEDAGSPVRAALALLGLPVHTLLPMQGDAPPVALDAAAPPLEALVEREQVLAAHPKLNAQAGQQLMRLWRAAGLGAALPALLAAYPAALPKPDDAVADNAGFVWNVLLDARAVDALELAADARPLVGNAALLSAFGDGLGIAPALRNALEDTLARWLAWLDDLALEGTPGASAYWNAQRLEYAFALGVGDAQSGARLEADEYTDGRLDWHTFAVNVAAPDAPGPVFAPPQVRRHEWKRLLPALAGYPGMPADRYWEFEDGRVAFGLMGAAKSDLARVAVLEYALVFGNDWFVLPLTLPVNALYKVDQGGFVVTDNFGFQAVIPPARNLDGTQWTMYEMSVAEGANAPRARLDDILYLCPSVETIESPPLEHVLVMRDEMANLVWAIEKRVQGASGEPLDRKFEATRLATTQTLRAAEGAPVAPSAPLSYRLQTPVAANWIPFLPVRKGANNAFNWAIQLQRGVVVQQYPIDAARLADARNLAYADFIARLRKQGFVETEEIGPAENRLLSVAFHPRGSLLRRDANAPATADYLRLEEEEVPRDGIELKRAFNYARDATGRAMLWIGRSKTTGRGEGASGLRFDVVARGGR